MARAQSIIEGQNLEIRRTLGRYSTVLEDHRVALMERRQAVLEGREVPDVWQTAPIVFAPLVEAAGEAAVRDAERVVTLACIDRAWCDHLALAADLREGVHLVALGGLDPLTRYTTDISIAASGKSTTPSTPPCSRSSTASASRTVVSSFPKRF